MCAWPISLLLAQYENFAKCFWYGAANFIQSVLRWYFWFCAQAICKRHLCFQGLNRGWSHIWNYLDSHNLSQTLTTFCLMVFWFLDFLVAFLHFILSFDLGGTFNSAQRLPLALHLGLNPGGFGGPYGMLGFKPKSSMCKNNDLFVSLLLCLPHIFKDHIHLAYIIICCHNSYHKYTSLSI